ncbi:MAG: ATP-binding protein [Chloroflexi bacterium]|nr:ATP-binding protein [Chloroflexota bacterium]
MNEESPLWLIVTGPPAAGKTTLARHIAPDLGLPLFEKDVFKDNLYADLGFGDKDWSRRIGISAINLLLLTADRMLQAGASLITESNFYRQFSSQQVREIADGTKAKVIQVHCSASPDVLIARNAARLDQNQQRIGHHVMPNEELLKGLRNGTWEPLDIPSEIIRVDTSSGFDYADVAGHIRRLYADD